MMQTAPILFIVFNRPETTQTVFESIRKAKPKRLYVSADGPRTDKPGEKERCDEVRRIATAVDWDCEVKTLFRPSNLGCKHAVAGGISWFFEQEEEGIIIEDDVLPTDSFYQFCTELLEKYRHEPKVASIGGCNFIADKQTAHPNSYAFIGHNHVWGWASWRRAWALNDLQLNRWPQWDASGGLLQHFNGDRCATDYWRSVFNRALKGLGPNTWDYQWMLSGWMSNSLTIMPAKNMVKNLGFGDLGTNTTKGQPGFLTRNPAGKIDQPLVHPQRIEIDPQADLLIKKYVTGLTHLRCLKRSFRRLLPSRW
jgi:hypothetical protein